MKLTLNWLREFVELVLPLDELCDAVQSDISPSHDGEWALATLEVCLAMLRSAQEGSEIALGHQVAARP